MEARYIKAYRGVFSPTLCDNLIKTYEKLWIEQEEYLKSISLCYNQDGVKKCGACDCQRLDIMQHKEFNEPFKLFHLSFAFCLDVLLPIECRSTT